MLGLQVLKDQLDCQGQQDLLVVLVPEGSKVYEVYQETLEQLVQLVTLERQVLLEMLVSQE
jgi:hypothetical protein